jgi:hypothetical protein
MAVLSCSACGQANRVPLETGTKGIVCGRCDADLPTPAIMWRLERVRDALEQLLRLYRWSSLEVLARTERGLERQHNILVNAAAAYPGFERTCRACPEIVEEIGELQRDIQRKLDRHPFNNKERIIIIVVRIVKIVFLAASAHLALPAGTAYGLNAAMGIRSIPSAANDPARQDDALLPYHR